MTAGLGAVVAVGWARATTAPTPPPAGGIDPTTGHGPEWGKAAPIGLLVILLLGVACYFLARSFSRNIKRVPESFEAVPAVAGVATSPAPAAPAPRDGSQAGPPGSGEPPGPPGSGEPPGAEAAEPADPPAGSERD